MLARHPFCSTAGSKHAFQLTGDDRVGKKYYDKRRINIRLITDRLPNIFYLTGCSGSGYVYGEKGRERRNEKISNPEHLDHFP